MTTYLQSPFGGAPFAAPLAFAGFELLGSVTLPLSPAPVNFTGQN